jgi:hypothetical protein
VTKKKLLAVEGDRLISAVSISKITIFALLIKFSARK